jgi:hypothetical protein
MKKIKGEGRTRFGRFAFVAVPATVASVGMGVAIVQGMVGATLASANAFTLNSDQITSDSLKVAAGSAGGTSASSTDGTATIYAETGPATTADQVHICAATPSLPFVGSVAIKIDSDDDSVSLPNVVLNASQLAVSDKDSTKDGTIGGNGVDSAATLSDVQLGVTSNTVGEGINGATTGGFADGGAGNQSYANNAFALGAGHSVLNNVDADSYAITLGGLALDALSLSVAKAAC